MARARAQTGTKRDRWLGEEIIVGSGETSDVAERLRRSIEGVCDSSKAALVSKTNGSAHTISWPKNTGSCELTLVSKDRNGKDIDDSAVTIPSKSWIESYSAPQATWSIVFRCATATGTCTLELDA